MPKVATKGLTLKSSNDQPVCRTCNQPDRQGQQGGERKCHHFRFHGIYGRASGIDGTHREVEAAGDHDECHAERYKTYLNVLSQNVEDVVARQKARIEDPA